MAHPGPNAQPILWHEPEFLELASTTPSNQTFRGIQNWLNQPKLRARLNGGDPSLTDQKSLSAYIMTAHRSTLVIGKSAGRCLPSIDNGSIWARIWFFCEYALGWTRLSPLGSTYLGANWKRLCTAQACPIILLDKEDGMHSSTVFSQRWAGLHTTQWPNA